MKRMLFAFALLFAYVTTNAQLVSYEKIDSFTVQELETVIANFGAAGLLIPQYDVDVYRVLYRTEYADSTTLVSGALAVPKNPDCPSPLVSYQHGTTSVKTGVPSFGSSELNICVIFAAEGNVVAAPDYVGLGVSTIEIHPYVHAFSQAHSTINLLRSVREMASPLNLNLSNQLFLFGYSQGGHATMAAAKYIETDYSDEFTVTAAAPMSGPYDLAGAQTDFVNSGQPYATPGYLPFLIFGYQGFHGDLYDSIPQYFRSPYDTSLYPLFASGTNGIGAINNVCTPIPSDMFTDEAEMAFNTDPNFPLRVRLEENSLTSWVPQTKVRMYYCTGDEQVFYRNAEIADSIWNANGGDDIQGVQVGTGDHGDCVQPALIAGRAFFSSLVNNGIEILASYNAATNEFETSVLNDDVSNYTIEWNNGDQGPNQNNIQDGITYTVTYTDNVTGCSNSKQLTKANVLSINGEDINGIGMQLYPNPTSDYLNVSVSIQNHYDVAIVDVAGKIVWQKKGIAFPELGIDVRYLSKGVYTLVIDNGTEYGKQFVIR